MSAFAFKKLDAFATSTSGGNPAGAVYLDSFDAITEPQMQRIARELKGFVSEVGYVAPAGPGAFRLRYFSSEKEVQFCGHATIAIAHDLFAHDAELVALARITLHTNRGVLPVDYREGSVFIQAPEPVFAESPIEAVEACVALNIPSTAIDPALPVGVVNAGNQTLCLPVRSCDDVTNTRPRYDIVRAFCDRARLDVITLFSTETADPANGLRTRVFAAPFGYLEDPATGSGNAALGYHLHRLGWWDGTPLRIEQGPDRDCPNLVQLEGLEGDGEGFRVMFGGSAAPRIDGRYWI